MRLKNDFYEIEIDAFPSSRLKILFTSVLYSLTIMETYIQVMDLCVWAPCPHTIIQNSSLLEVVVVLVPGNDVVRMH